MLKYPSCFNSAKMMDTTCNAILSDTFISLISINATNLDGLKYFKNARQIYIIDNLLLSSLPILPASLTRLICKSNSLKSLTKLPITLKQLYCSNNKLDSLPVLPQSIRELDISKNNLKILPQLNDSLELLDFSYNKFAQFPILPKFLKYLYCGGDNFSFIDKLPETLESFQLYNTQPTCISKLPQKLKFFSADWWNAISCMPNYPDTCTYIVCSSPMCPQIPPVGICNPTNNKNNCHPNKLVSVFVFVDYNNNNKLDSNEFPKSNVKLSLSTSNYTYSNSNGAAQMYADSLGTYTITVTPPAFYNAVPLSYTHNFTSYDTIINDTFALKPNTLKDSLSIVATPINFAARPGFSYAYRIQYENVGTTILSPTINFNFDNNLLTYDSSSNSAVLNNGNLTLSQSNFVPGQNGIFVAYFKVKPTAALGTNLLAALNISAGSCFGVDSVTTVVRGSYDPNDKHATPMLTLQDVINKKYINYVIHFQNTGTDTAFNVVIADTLSAYLKTNNLQGVTSSHPCKSTIKNGVVYFEFIDIDLPDSNTNKIASNGYVRFQVLADESIAAGTIIPNKAYIYFDYNKSVLTNIATTTIQNPLPLTLVNFGALSKPINEISVYWATANEVNTKYFIIEVSADGNNFKPAAELAAIGFGDNQYSISIPSITTVYLRLRIVDKDGKIAYSKVVKISEAQNSGITISPNPAKNYLNITVGKIDFSNAKSKLINSVGLVVKSFVLKSGLQHIDITDLAMGVYYLQTGPQTIKIFVEK